MAIEVAGKQMIHNVPEFLVNSYVCAICNDDVGYMDNPFKMFDWKGWEIPVCEECVEAFDNDEMSEKDIQDTLNYELSWAEGRVHQQIQKIIKCEKHFERKA